VTINLTINITPASELTVDACDRYNLPGGTQTWTESGVYQEVFDTAGECDSVVTVNLTIHLSTTADLSVTACDSYLSPSAGEVWMESGIYLDTIANEAGCEAHNHELSIITIDANVTQEETLLTADMAGVTYQWIGVTMK
jgi:hypothetical protein